MNSFRPIDEELMRLHQPVIVEDSDTSALDGFSVTNSGSVMVPTGSTPPTHFQRSSSSISGLSSSFNSQASNPAPPPSLSDPYYHSGLYGQSVSPGYASDPYSYNNQAQAFTRGTTPPAQYLSSSLPQHNPHHHQQLQFSQAYPMHYGSYPTSWR